MATHFKGWIVLVAVLLCAPIAEKAQAWGHEGHQTIGAIADSLLAGTHAEKAIASILGAEKLETAALWADCVKGVSDSSPYSYHLNARYPECDPFQQSATGRQEMEDYVRRNSSACRRIRRNSRSAIPTGRHRDICRRSNTASGMRLPCSRGPCRRSSAAAPDSRHCAAWRMPVLRPSPPLRSRRPPPRCAISATDHGAGSSAAAAGAILR